MKNSYLSLKASYYVHDDKGKAGTEVPSISNTDVLLIDFSINFMG
jgi:hypothetical protein